MGFECACSAQRAARRRRRRRCLAAACAHGGVGGSWLMAARAIALAMQNSMHTTKLPFENAPTSSSAVLACRLPSRLSGTPACSNVARSCCGDASLTTGFLSSEADSAYSHSRSAAFFFFFGGCVLGALGSVSTPPHRPPLAKHAPEARHPFQPCGAARAAHPAAAAAPPARPSFFRAAWARSTTGMPRPRASHCPQLTRSARRGAARIGVSSSTWSTA